MVGSGGKTALAGSVEFQACNDTQCLAPASVAFHADPSASAAAPSASPATGLTGGAIPLSEARRLQPLTAAPGASQDFGELLKRRGLLAVLLMLFGWGLALNLTPCVYPVIPLTVSFFGGQAHGQSRRTVLLASTYVLGMATTYSTLGVAAALSGRLFGAALQSPWVVAGVALVLVLLALSMFGLYDIRMPTALMQKAGARQGFAGAYAMGLLVGVVAAPCVGPVVLGLLAFVAATQDAALGFLFFFVLSLGLGLPFLFLAAFSSRIAALPRAGAWMEGRQEGVRLGAAGDGRLFPADRDSGPLRSLVVARRTGPRGGRAPLPPWPSPAPRAHRGRGALPGRRVPLRSLCVEARDRVPPGLRTTPEPSRAADAPPSWISPLPGVSRAWSSIARRSATRASAKPSRVGDCSRRT